MRVRTYGFPGFFYEANPESSTRNTETKEPHVEAGSPPYVPSRIAVRAQKRRGPHGFEGLHESRPEGLLDRVGGRAFHLDGLALYHLVRVCGAT